MDITIEHLEAKKAERLAIIEKIVADLNANQGAVQMLDLLISEAKQQPTPPCETPLESSLPPCSLEESVPPAPPPDQPPTTPSE